VKSGTGGKGRVEGLWLKKEIRDQHGSKGDREIRGSLV